MKKIFLVRHGEVKNPQGIIYGRLPHFGLSKRGEKQVAETAKYLQEVLVVGEKIIFSSPLLRARQSAKILAKFISSAKIILEEQLTEGDLGWEGKPKIELIKSGVWQLYLDEPEKITTGEGFKGVQQRVVAWLKKKITEKTPSQWIVVSHQDVLRLLTLWLEKRPLNDLNKIPCSTASVTTIVINRKLELVRPIVYWEPDEV